MEDKRQLDRSGFALFAQAAGGMEIVDRFFSAYGNGPPRALGPEQDLVERQGNPCLEERFPRRDYVRRGRITPSPKGWRRGSLLLLVPRLYWV